MQKAPFHLALPCRSIKNTKDFYVNALGAQVGRHSSGWIDIDLYGNQITFTKSGDFNFSFKSYKFEDAILPAFHFGVIVDVQSWNTLYKRLDKKILGLRKSSTFLHDKPGEHTSFFIEDPDNHTVEFKCFRDPEGVFSR